MAESQDQSGTDADLGAGERPTLKTIARLTGMSVATASRALSDADDISADTKLRVREAAERVGYRPNRAGVRLRTGKTNVISLVMATDHDMMNHTARLITSIASALRGTPYHMIVTPYDASDDPMEPIRYIIDTGSADAVILNQTTPKDPRIDFLMRRHFPFVTHGRTAWCGDHPYVDFDNTAFGQIAVAELARRGRRNVLLVLPPLAQNYGMNMRDGALQRAAELGVKALILENTNSDDPGQKIEAAITAVMRGRADIDGFICASTTACMATVAAIEALGRTPGGDVDLVAKEAIPFLKHFREPILTVHEDVSKAGQLLARAAISRIANPDAPPLQHLEVPAPIA